MSFISSQKNAHHRKIRKYLCLNCKHSFSSKRRPDNLQQIIFKEYFYHRQTATELAAKHHKSERWIREKIHHYQPIVKPRKGRDVVLVLDATFFGKRKDKFGLMIAKDIHTKEAVSYHFIVSETNKEYIQFLYIALGSAAEVETQLLIARDLEYVESIDTLYNEVQSIKRMLLLYRILIFS